MTVSWYGIRGGRSRFQSKYGFTTTERGTYGAESALFRRSGCPNWYENTGWPQSTAPSIALAYGSSSSLCGLQRFPSFGWYGPCTRYPYRWPGLLPVGYLGEQGEVRPGTVIRGPQRIALARPYGSCRQVFPSSHARAFRSSHTF